MVRFLVIRSFVMVELLACCIFLAGCDSDRIARLERENADLKSKVEKQSLVADYDLQAKCGKDARAWFNENWSGNGSKDTIFLNFTNHYSAKLNKCFILVEYHYKSHLAGPSGESWSNDMSLSDVYENEKYGQFDENHYTYYKPEIRTGDEVIFCAVQGKQCKSSDEFSNFVSTFMAE